MTRTFLSITLAVLLVIGTAGVASATHGYQLIGIGQAQKSMGGAVTAVPTSSMTAISNPAGMALIGSRADFSMEAFMPTRSVDFTGLGGERTEGGSKLYGIPSIGWVAPAFGRDDVFFGGGMFATSGLGVDYGESIMMPGAALDMMSGAPMGTFEDVKFDGFSSIQFWKIAPTIAWKANDNLAVGFSLNVDYQSVTIREKLSNVPFFVNPMNPAAGIVQRDVSLDLGRPTSQMGAGATVGVIYKANDMITVGASYASKQFFKEGEFRVGSGDISVFNGATGLPGTYKLDLEFPQQFSAGIAVKPVSNLTISGDVKWINWAQTHEEVSLSGPDGAFDSNGDGVPDSSSTKLAFGWENQWVFAGGLMYTATDSLVLTAGYSYAQAPIDEADVFNNLVFPAIVEQHITAGFQYQLGKHWGIGASYMKAFKETFEGKNDVPVGFQMATPFTADSGAKISLEEDSVSVNLSYLF